MISHDQNILAFRESVEKVKNNRDVFFTWFDKPDVWIDKSTCNNAFIQGDWDFSTHILPHLVGLFDRPEEKTIVEIGCGGGRLLAAASRYFRSAIGLDIHTCGEVVVQELRRRGVLNADFITIDGKSIPLRSESIDIIYSYIVFQHVQDIMIFKRYVQEMGRVLKRNGIAVFYFGRYCKFSLNKKWKLLYCIDKFLEKILLKKGFKEMDALVNCINLIISLDYAKKICRNNGLIIVREVVSKRLLPGKRWYGLQNGLVVKKL